MSSSSSFNNENFNNKNHNNGNNNLKPNKVDANEIERLKVLINQEEQLKQTVEQSYNELLTTSKELEKRMNMIDEESNEWKTRFENQEEINRQLEKQIAVLEKKLDETKNMSKNVKNKIPITNGEETKPEFIAELHKTKESLNAQIKDYSWRLEQENKAYYKANEERKELHQELLDTRNFLSFMKENKKNGGITHRVFRSETNGNLANKSPNSENIIRPNISQEYPPTKSGYLPSINNNTSPNAKSDTNLDDDSDDELRYNNHNNNNRQNYYNNSSHSPVEHELIELNKMNMQRNSNLRATVQK